MAETISILDLTLDAAANALEKALITDVHEPKDQDTIAAVVRAGRLQSSPLVDTGISILLHPNHPVDEEYFHEIAARYTMRELGLVGEAWELGGSLLYWRKYTTELKVFIRTRERETARRIANVVLNRAENTLWRELGRIGPDSFGEGVIITFVTNSYIREGGGPGTFTWLGEIRFQTLNERTVF